MAGVQRPRPRGGARRAQPAARAAEVHRDLRDQPRRVLHDPHRRAHAAACGRGAQAFRRRAHARGAARAGQPPSSPFAGADDRLPEEPALPVARAPRDPHPAPRPARHTDDANAAALLRRARLPRPHPAGDRQGASVPVHLEPLDLARRRARGSDARGAGPLLRARQGARLAAAFRADRLGAARPALVRDARRRHRAQSRGPVSGLARHRVVSVPGHPRRRPRSAGRRSRRLAARGRVRAAQATLRRTGAPRGRARHARRAPPQAARGARARLWRLLRSRRDDGDREPLDDRQPRPARAARSAVHAVVPQAADRTGRHVRGDSRRRSAAAPSLRVVRSGRAVRAAGSQRSECVGDQADVVPHFRQLAGGRRAGRRRRERQAGCRADRAQGAVRRGEQHPLGADARARRRSRRLRPGGPQDAREGDAGRARRARRHPALHALRHRQLQRSHGAHLHRPVAVHVPGGPGRGRDAAVQRADRLLEGRQLRAAAGRAVRAAHRLRGADRSRDRARRSRPAERYRGQAQRDQRRGDRAGALPRVTRRRPDRPDGARHVRAAP